MYRSAVLGGVCLALCAALCVAGPVQAGGKKVGHPRLHIALYELRKAQVEMKEAGTDFGGHKLKAMKATKAAIRQIELCLEAVGEGTKGLPPGKGDFKKFKNFPHIRHAAVALRDAREALENAPSNFGGHKADAIRDIDRALEQLRLAIKAAER
jgi:hypothetical protein